MQDKLLVYIKVLNIPFSDVMNAYFSNHSIM